MEELLISAVYKRQALWDPTNELRKNSQILKSLWTEVAQEIGVDVNVAKNRWKNLRAYFMFQLREFDKPKSGSSKNVKTTSSWAFYNQLLFLKDVLTSADDTRDYSLVSTQASETSYQPLADETNDDCYIENFLDSYLPEEGTEKDSGTCANSADKPIISTSQPGKEKLAQKKDESDCQAGKNIDYHIRRANKRRLNTSFEGATQNRRFQFSTVQRPNVNLLEREMNVENNPDLLFFKSLLPYMDDFTPMQRLRIRSEIQDLILAEHEGTQRGTHTMGDFSINATAVIPPYHELLLRPPSRSSASADSA